MGVLNLAEFNENFEKRMKEEKIKKRDNEVIEFLKVHGFQEFTSDGKYFLDSDGRRYGDHGLIIPFKKLEDSVEMEYETRLMGIKPEKDLFSIIHCDTSYEFFRLEKNPIYFVNNRIPSSQDYNGFVLFDGISWHRSAIDGSHLKTMHPVLMLNFSIKRVD